MESEKAYDVFDVCERLRRSGACAVDDLVKETVSRVGFRTVVERCDTVDEAAFTTENLEEKFE